MNHDEHSAHDMHAAQSNAGEYAKFAAVIAGILLLSFALSRQNSFMETFMGVFFVVFSQFKMAGYSMFVSMFPMYDLIAKKSTLYAQMYPIIELSFGLAYLLDFGGRVRDATVMIVMFVGAAGVLKVISRGQHIQCACLGNIIRLPLSTVTLAEDALMGVMALWLLL